ncbi:MAG: arylesterase [Candidatus Paceibacterota bacterium]
MKKTTSFAFIIVVLAGLSWAGYALYKTQNTESRVNTPATQAEKGETKIIAVGDSLTAGYGLPLAESYPMQLENKLQENGFSVEVINAGVSGETTAGLLERVEFIKSNEPEMILITIGGNDALRNLPIENTEKNIRAILRVFKEVVPGENIFLMQVRSPLNAGLAYATRFNAIYTDLAKQEGVHLVPFVETEVFLNSDLMLEDRIHPNKAGYAKLIEKYIYKAVAAELR